MPADRCSLLSATTISSWSATSRATPPSHSLAAGREHALNRELAQAETVDDALRAAVDELRRLWRARQVMAVTFADNGAEPRVVTCTDPTRWSDLTTEVQDQVRVIRGGELLTP